MPSSRRAPQGARGLKLVLNYGRAKEYGSRPARGAWIETSYSFPMYSQYARRAPQGARGLKHPVRSRRCAPRLRSRPARGAWIETRCTGPSGRASTSRPARGAWIETYAFKCSTVSSCQSRPARGAWIETVQRRHYAHRIFRRAPQGARGLKLLGVLDGLVDGFVAPRKGRVD